MHIYVYMYVRTYMYTYVVQFGFAVGGFNPKKFTVVISASHLFSIVVMESKKTRKFEYYIHVYILYYIYICI